MIVTAGFTSPIITSAVGTIDVPAAFVTSVVDGARPNDPQPANRSTLGTSLPSVDNLTNGALADADILAAPPPVPVDASAGQDATPADTAFAAGASDTALLLRCPILAAWCRFRRPPPCALAAALCGTGRSARVTWTPSVRMTPARLAPGTASTSATWGERSCPLPTSMCRSTDMLNFKSSRPPIQTATVSANALQTLSNTRVGVRAGWAVVTAVYTAHPTASTQLVAQSAGRLGQAPGDTQFLVASDGSSTWVVVTQGTAQVEPVAATPGSIPASAAPATPVVVSAGSQTWVDPGQPPVPPVPATRAAVGSKFPTLEDLTNGELSDAQVLAGSAVAPIKISAPVTITPPSTGQSQAACYRFTSTPIGGKTYALTMRFGSLPAPAVTYCANTWFYAKYVSLLLPQRPTVTISANGTEIQTAQSADTLVDLSNGAKQSFVNLHYIDSLIRHRRLT